MSTHWNPPPRGYDLRHWPNRPRVGRWMIWLGVWLAVCFLAGVMHG